MQVDSFSLIYIKAQESSERHVDVWTRLSTSASKTLEASA